MLLEGRIKNGVVVFDAPVSLPEGTPVRVEVVGANGQPPAEPPGHFLTHYQDVIGTISDLPEDAASNVNHDRSGSRLMFDRITSDPAILGGKPIVRATRISVAMILEWVASGATRADIIRKHPHLTKADIEQALAYAAAGIRNEVLLSAEVGV